MFYKFSPRAEEKVDIQILGEFHLLWRTTNLRWFLWCLKLRVWKWFLFCGFFFFLIQIFVVSDTVSGTQYLPGEQVWAFSLLFFSILSFKILASCIFSILDSSFQCSDSLSLSCVHSLTWALPVPPELFLVLPRSLGCLLFGKAFLPVLAILLWVLTWCDPSVLHLEW